MKLTRLIAAFTLLGTLVPASHAWAQARPDRLEDQLAEDVTPIPAGMGALFVPALTDPYLEPMVIVFAGRDRVASGRTGERIVLPPGRYRVVVGQGATSERASTEVRVIAGATVPVKSFFGALRLSLVDNDTRRVNEEYVIASSDGKRVYGPVQVDDSADAQPARTWLLPPGKYIVSLGDEANAERNSVAVVVSSGEVLSYRLVIEDGTIQRSEFADKEFVAEPSIWRLRWLVGGSAQLMKRERQLTGFNGDSALISTFSKLEAGIDTGRHLALLSVNIDQTFVGLDSKFGSDVPLRTLSNESEAELLYTYRVAGIVGPYARGIARTSLFEDHYFPDTDVALVTRDEDGNVVQTGTGTTGDRIRLFRSFAPLVLQEGAGLNVSVVDGKYATFAVRGGPALRQAYYRQGRYVDGREGDTVDLVRLDDNHRFGGELTAIAGLRLGDSFTYESRFDSFLPKEQLFEGETLKPIFRWDNAIGLRLSRSASAIYSVTLKRDELSIDETQTAQSLALRFQHVLF